ncbi:hypothetical protein LINPERHAP2_LOCUS17033 [Linum perenne]
MGRYLGVPFEWGNTKTETVKYILERLSSKAQNWKSCLLSHTGRETMIKAVLQVNLILYMQRTWDMRRLRIMFSEQVIRFICSIPIGPENFKDEWISCYDPKGRFSVKSYYKVIKGKGRQ